MYISNNAIGLSIGFFSVYFSQREFMETLESAYLYAKTVTLGETHWPETNRVLLRNRRIGCSMSGIAQFISKQGVHGLGALCRC